MDKIKINLKENSYQIMIGINNLSQIGREARAFGNAAFMISNPKIFEYYGKQCLDSFRKNGVKEIEVALIPEGEKNKSIESWKKLMAKLIAFDNGMNKKIFVANLGGGVIGDLGGFVAASFKRGIPFIQIPTTLLSMVDSGVGGKVGVNYKNAKNIIGAFYQPKLVFADLAVLKTLPDREIRAGLAEVIKYGVIADPKLFSFLEKNYPAIQKNDLDCLKKIVLTSYKIKARIVEKDEKDRIGIRIVLNYGHTIGHAIEAASGYKQYLHGEAIAIGMIGAANIAMALGLLTEKEAGRIERLITAIGLPTRITKIRSKDILNSLKHDKKFVEGKNRFVLPIKIGRTTIKENIPGELIKSTIEGLIKKQP